MDPIERITTAECPLCVTARELAWILSIAAALLVIGEWFI